MRAAPFVLASVAGTALVALSPAPSQACSCSSCCLSTTHQVNVPGVSVTPPSVTIQQAGVGFSGSGSLDSSSSVGISAQVSASSSSSGSSSSGSQSSSASATNGSVASFLASGGGGSFTPDVGPSTSIGSLTVEGPATTRPVCTAYKAAFKAVAVQAVCLDDKAVPHPASQLGPERDIADAYEGEVFRCIAGSRMQYTLGAFDKTASFEHGQTVVCEKGEALYHSADGRLQCRPQKPARDCNERSLLRRFGAGIKVVRLAAEKVCVSWGQETVAAQTDASPEAMSFDGGVGR